MPLVCFQGKFRNSKEDEEKSKTSQDEIDIYELMVIGLKIGIRMDDYNNMDFPMLFNLLDASIPKRVEETKPKYRMATQKDIDMIT